MEEIDKEQPEEIIHKFLEDQLQGIDVDQIVQFQLDKLDAEYYQTQVQKKLDAQEEIKEEKDQQQIENEMEQNQSFNEAYQYFDNVEYQAVNYEMLDSDSEEEQKQNKEEDPQPQSQEENNQQNSFDFEEFSPQQQNQQSDGVFECVPQFKEN